MNMSLDKAVIKLNDYITTEIDEEKREVFSTAVKGITALFSLREEVENQIGLVGCSDKSCQKWFELGERHVANVIDIAMKEVEK